MKNKKAEVVDLLVEEGNNFTYSNFSTKGKYGYPDAVKPEWIAWQARVQNIITALFGAESAPLNMLKQGLEVVVLGNGPDKFNQAKSYFIGSLKAAQAVLKEDTFGEMKKEAKNIHKSFSNEIFIVHGHDNKSKSELEIFVKEIGLEPIVLHRKPDSGQTIIEKFEKYSNVGFAFILLTPDEISYLVDQEKLEDKDRKKEKRARPNVIFEFGYFVGKLTRKRVCCLFTGDVTLPSDVNGLLYKKFEKSIDEVAYPLIKELKALGYRIIA